jgi:SWI/SNF-related matrix-associated actin-dependent regulator of chromatin subfamily A member 5
LGEQLASSEVKEEMNGERMMEEEEGKILAPKMDHINKLEVLLAQSDLFLFLDKINRCESQKQFLEIFEAESLKLHKTPGVSHGNSTRTRITLARRESIDEEEQSSREEILDDIRITTQSKSIKGGDLKDYQFEGMNWILTLYKKNLNGILADEMGLGKTIQTISSIAEIEDRLTEEDKQRRSSFHLIIVPKITLYNWENELKRWLPSARVFMFYGTREERDKMKAKDLKEGKFDVIVTTYDIVRKESYAMSKLNYDLMVIDEAHNIKNSKSVLSQVLRKLHSKHRLLLTGTPLQNNLQELWSLLNFIMPNIFDSIEDFSKTFHIDNSQPEAASAQAEEKIVQQIHRLLRPFMLRRIKAEVEHSLPPKKEMYLYFGLTKLQRKIYKNILKNHSHIVNGNGDRAQLMNILMQLKKVCNHPYLFNGVEEGPPFVNGEHLVTNCMKFKVLDLLLPRLKEQNSRVLIFSQMSSLLDILDDYVRYRGYTYCRIDGQTSALDRELRIEDFQRPDSDKFIFLLTTRAGGCGINLHGANTVILYDSDWNPQVDLQAIDRAHRIGQKREVVVYRFVTEGTVEEKIIERAAKRLKMENLVMQKGRFNAENKVGTNDITKIIQFGAQKLISKSAKDGDSEEDCMIEDQIDRIFEYSESKAEILNKELSDLEHKYDLKSFTINSKHEHDMYVFDGENYYGKKKEEELLVDDKIEIIDFGARERKQQNYDINKYYQKALNIVPVCKEKKKIIGWRHQANGGYDHQFFNTEELDKLEEKEEAWKEYIEQCKNENKEVEKDEEKEFTKKDRKKKDELLSEGFGNWSKKDLMSFIRGCEKYGRNSYEKIATEIRTKTIQEVEQYSAIFWKRVRELENGARFIERVTKGEAEIKKSHQYEEIISTKFSSFGSHLIIDDIYIDYGKSQPNQQHYTKEEDQFLAYCMYKFGFGTWELYRFEIENSEKFLFDWKFIMRSGQELQRRCEYLIQCFKREIEKRKKRPKEIDHTKDSKKNSKKVKIKFNPATSSKVKKKLRKLENDQSASKGRSTRAVKLKKVVPVEKKKEYSSEEDIGEEEEEYVPSTTKNLPAKRIRRTNHH